MSDELRYHIDAHTEDLTRLGVPREEAARRARVAFGGVERVKEECRQARGLRLFDELHRDVRFALRGLRKNPGFTAVAVLTLALGIGANTAVFSIVDGVLLNPIPFAEPDRLVSIYGTNASGTKNSISYPNFLDWQRDNRTFEVLAAWRGSSFAFTGSSDPEVLTGQMVAANFFDVLRVQPLFGRVFLTEEDRLGAVPVVVLGEGFWTRRFAADPGVGARDVRSRRARTLRRRDLRRRDTPSRAAHA